jgi:acyl dehydratase
MAVMTASRTFSVTQDTINAWARLSGDQNPLHVSEEYARTTRFGGTIAHGHYTLALIEELLYAEHGAAWLTGGLLRDVRFTAPIRPGRAYAIRLLGGPGRQRVEVRDSADETLAVEGLAVQVTRSA